MWLIPTPPISAHVSCQHWLRNWKCWTPSSPFRFPPFLLENRVYLDAETMASNQTELNPRIGFLVHSSTISLIPTMSYIFSEELGPRQGIGEGSDFQKAYILVRER